MRVRTGCLISLVCLGLLAAPCLWSAIRLAPEILTDRSSRVRITISKETTYITEPLREDGYPDYFAALNNACSKGVTPENNAAVLFLQAFGPERIGVEDRQRLFAFLGMRPLPDEGDYFLPVRAALDPAERDAPTVYVNGVPKDLPKPFDRACRAPWKGSDFPVVAAWLDQNSGPLALVVAGTRRSRYYWPLITSGERMPLSFVCIPPFWYEDAAQAFSARAMLRLQNGKINDAREDLLACHRLARLTAQAPTILEFKIAWRIDSLASRADAALAHHGRLTAAQAKEFAEELRRLPAFPNAVDKLGHGERFAGLQMLCLMAQFGPSFGDSNLGTGEKMLDRSLRAMTDWDALLRLTNQWYDRYEEVAAIPGWDERSRASADLSSARGPAAFRGARQSSERPPPPLPTREHERAFLALCLPDCSGAFWQEGHAALQAQFAQVALALAAYRADHGRYPEKLDALRPKYLNDFPLDPFSGKPFRFRCDGKDYTLYSVGPDGRDDGGRSGEYPDPNPVPMDESPKLDGSLRGFFPGGFVVHYDDIAIRTSPAFEPDRKQP